MLKENFQDPKLILSIAFKNHDQAAQIKDDSMIIGHVALLSGKNKTYLFLHLLMNV